MPRLYLYRIQADQALLQPFLLCEVITFLPIFALHARNGPIDPDASPNFRNVAGQIVPFVAHRQSCRQTHVLVTSRVFRRS